MSVLFAPERRNEIRKLVRQHRRMNFDELQRLMKVSPATLRRDLVEIEKTGEIIRVHGGVLDPAYARAELSFEERVLRQGGAKKGIAGRVASLIPAGAHVFIDAGSTCLEAGKALLHRKDIQIITHSVSLIEAALHGEAELLCIGGSLRKVSGAMTGASAMKVLGLLRADWALVGASGLDPREGCFTTELSEAEIKREALARASHKVLLADFSKWRHVSTVRFAEWNEFNHWVTDKIPSREQTRELRRIGVKIHGA
jgi:DeoR/GlpR family transcriptional regulator of sugar metabolism